jgi:hypothetical protein
MSYDSQLDYFWIKDYTIENGVTESGRLERIYVWTNEFTQIIPVRIISEPAHYYEYANNTFSTVKEKTYDKEYYEVNAQPIDIFYRPYRYYFSKDKINYAFGIGDMDHDATYYTLLREPNALKFYEPNKFYYENEKGELVIDDSPIMTQDRDYFNSSEWYIFSDVNNILVPGAPAPWMDSGVEPPEGVKVGSRKEKWVWKELKDFASSLNTIHGLIIHINKILKTGDTITRDRDTVQGCINSINDILDRINALTPGCLVATDKYNRFVTT